MISVVYVDDDPYLAMRVSRLCERCGRVRVHPLSSPEEAIAWTEHHPVDVIVSEYTLPGMNGIELLKILRDRGVTAPFIIFTGLEDNEVAYRSELAGVSGYLIKNDNIMRQVSALVDLIVLTQTNANAPENQEGDPGTRHD